MPTSIIDRQKHDHAHLGELIHRYRAEGPNERRGTFREIVKLVTTHAFAEEEVLFPAARRILGGPGEAMTSEIERQHQRVNELLKEMESGEPGDSRFEERVDELFPLLSDDVRNEEERLLPSVAEHLDRDGLDQLGTAWAAAKAAAPTRAHPRIPRRPPGNVIAGIPLLLVDRVRDLFARLRHSSQ